VIIPFSFDQPDNAQRMKRLGVAEVLSRRAMQVTPIAAKLERILNDVSYSKRARDYAAQINPPQAMVAVVDKMEKLRA
jgi:UDP:flavonoid glycosyltransferase YjiC (YdhE family)